MEPNIFFLTNFCNSRYWIDTGCRSRSNGRDDCKRKPSVFFVLGDGRVKIIGATKVESKGQEMTISGICKDDVGQTFSNLKIGTKIRNRDSRVFQDGYYIVEE